MSPTERFLNDAVYQDLADHRPDLLLVLRPARDVRVNGRRRLDYLGYFGHDLRTAVVLRRYRFARNVGEFDLYERGAAPPESVRSPEPGTLDLPRRRRKGWAGLLANRDLLLQFLLFSAGTAAACLAGRGRAGGAR
jgi:hypothetical protein